MEKKREYTPEDMERLGEEIELLRKRARQVDQDIRTGAISHEQWVAVAHELLERKKEILEILADVDRSKMDLRAEIEEEKKLRMAAEEKIAVLSAEVLKSFGVDTSNLPEGAKAIVRKRKKDEWTIQLFYYSPARVYTKVYRIGRFNVPKNDPMNSKKPQTIVANNPLMPSFCRFYFASKFAYNLSEENVIRMLKSMKCHFPQSTLNKYIHQIMDYLRVRLEGLMLEVGKIMSLLKKIRAEKDKYGALVMRAVNYIFDDEEAFKKFLQDGRIEMHNNAVESVFRHIAMGRRCWLNSGSHEAASNIAFMYSLFESCKMNDIDFGEYVEDILTRMMNGDEDYRSMIPCRSISDRLLPEGRKNYKTGKKQEKKVA